MYYVSSITPGAAVEKMQTKFPRHRPLKQLQPCVLTCKLQTIKEAGGPFRGTRGKQKTRHSDSGMGAGAT